MFLIMVLYAAFVFVLLAIGLPLALVIVIAVAILGAQYWFSDKIAMYSMHAHIATPEQAPQLHAIVDRLCALADMPKPQVAIAQTDMPNAFATGRNPKHAVVCATTGIMRRLNEPELEAVLAHELSHVAHRDVAVMTFAGFLGIMAGLLMRMMMFAGMFGGFGAQGGRARAGRNQMGGGQIFLLEMGVMVVAAIVWFLSFLLTRALSRYRELAADRSGAILIGRPSLLASALQKVTGDMARIPSQDLRQARAFNAFFFSPAITHRGSGGTLFSTHPSLQKRLAQLQKLESEMNSPR